MAPTVDGLESEYEGKVSVKRVDANDEGDLSQKLNIQVVPTYIFLDSVGDVIERQEGGNSQRLEESFRKAAGELGD